MCAHGCNKNRERERRVQANGGKVQERVGGSRIYTVYDISTRKRPKKSKLFKIASYLLMFPFLRTRSIYILTKPVGR